MSVVSEEGRGKRYKCCEYMVLHIRIVPETLGRPS